MWGDELFLIYHIIPIHQYVKYVSQNEIKHM